MAKTYVYTDLSVADALYLEIDGARFEVTQFSSAWAVNEVPVASLLLAVGRHTHTGEPASIHRITRHMHMQPAKVWFHPREEYSLDDRWPEGPRVVFDGFFVGLGYRKVLGKVHVIVNLIHWLAALNFSSCLTKNGHVSNPTQLNAAAVLSSLGFTFGEGCYIAELVPAAITGADIGADLWKAIKTVFCRLADVPTVPFGPDEIACGGGGNGVKNDTARAALARIEGPVSLDDDAEAPCGSAYRWGVPLKMETLGASTVEDSISLAIGMEAVESWASRTFWDKLVRQYCPIFGLAVVPRVDAALVVADTPALSGEPPPAWRVLDGNEYDSYDMTAELHLPLRAVGVISNYESQTQAGINGPDVLPVVGACYAEDAVAPGDGLVMFVSPPPWLEMISTQPNGVNPNTQSDTLGVLVSPLYERWAHYVFTANMLRGRSGTIGGKLRFDIAPGSIVKIINSGELFIGAEDELAKTVYGAVQRVSITISAESAMAGTSLMLSHIRTEEENKSRRTSVLGHPLFDKSIHGGGLHGCPLIDDYWFPVEGVDF